MSAIKSIGKLAGVTAFAACSFFFASAARSTPLETKGAVVELPPFIVSGTREQFVRYVELPEIRVLSSCSREVTAEFSQRQFLLHRVLDACVPPKFRLTASVPETVILVDERTNREAIEITESLIKSESASIEPTQNPRPVTSHFLPNLRLSDRDSTMIFTVVREREFDPSALMMADDYLRFLLEQRAPPLPRWFIEGMLQVLNDSRLTRSGLMLQQFVWVSPRITSELQDRDILRTTTVDMLGILASDGASMLSFDEFFGDRNPNPDRGEQRIMDIRRCQAAVLIRLALDSPEWSEKLHRLVERAIERKISEQDFAECMGMDYAHVRGLLEKYLNALVKVRVLHPVILHVPLTSPVIHVRTPTEVEIARIRGDWERRVERYVQTRYPQYAEKYASQARRTFAKGYRDAPNDPELLAVFGLFETQEGRHEAAARYLEKAVQAKALRPSAYVALAWNRYRALRQIDANGRPQISEHNAAEILRILLAGHTQAPAMPETYRLMAEVWDSTTAKPSSADLAMLSEGLRFFPADLDLLYHAASVFLKNGRPREATEMLDAGENLDVSQDHPFRALRTLLEHVPRTGE